MQIKLCTLQLLGQTSALYIILGLLLLFNISFYFIFMSLSEIPFLSNLDPSLTVAIIVLVMVWTLYWKGRALWTSARAGSWRWFIALLLINTLGILEILYLYVFHRPKND